MRESIQDSRTTQVVDFHGIVKLLGDVKQGAVSEITFHIKQGGKRGDIVLSDPTNVRGKLMSLEGLLAGHGGFVDLRSLVGRVVTVNLVVESNRNSGDILKQGFELVVDYGEGMVGVTIRYKLQGIDYQ